MAAVSSFEPSSTTRTSASQFCSAMQESTRSSACSMRALSLYAGITILNCGWAIAIATPVPSKLSNHVGCTEQGVAVHHTVNIGRAGNRFGLYFSEVFSCCGDNFRALTTVPAGAEYPRGWRSLLNFTLCRKITYHHLHRLLSRLVPARRIRPRPMLRIRPRRMARRTRARRIRLLRVMADHRRCAGRRGSTWASLAARWLQFVCWCR